MFIGENVFNFFVCDGFKLFWLSKKFVDVKGFCGYVFEIVLYVIDDCFVFSFWYVWESLL